MYSCEKLEKILNNIITSAEPDLFPLKTYNPKIINNPKIS